MFKISTYFATNRCTLKPVLSVFIGMYLLVLVSLTCSISAFAQSTVYVADNLFVPMRSGAGNEYRIINAAMRSGTKFTKLSESEDGKWVQVQTTKGTTGWILNQHLSTQTPTSVRLAKATKQRDTLQKKVTELQQKVATLTQQNTLLTGQLNEASGNQSALTSELASIKAISGNAINLDLEHRKLIQEHELLRAKSDTLEAENSQLSSSNEISFMVYGALLVVLGMFLVIILPVFKPNKRRNDWTN